MKGTSKFSLYFFSEIFLYIYIYIYIYIYLVLFLRDARKNILGRYETFFYVHVTVSCNKFLYNKTY